MIGDILKTVLIYLSTEIGCRAVPSYRHISRLGSVKKGIVSGRDVLLRVEKRRVTRGDTILVCQSSIHFLFHLPSQIPSNACKPGYVTAEIAYTKIICQQKHVTGPTIIKLHDSIQPQKIIQCWHLTTESKLVLCNEDLDFLFSESFSRFLYSR